MGRVLVAAEPDLLHGRRGPDLADAPVRRRQVGRHPRRGDRLALASAPAARLGCEPARGARPRARPPLRSRPVRRRRRTAARRGGREVRGHAAARTSTGARARPRARRGPGAGSRRPSPTFGRRARSGPRACGSCPRRRTLRGRSRTSGTARSRAARAPRPARARARPAPLLGLHDPIGDEGAEEREARSASPHDREVVEADLVVRGPARASGTTAASKNAGRPRIRPRHAGRREQGDEHERSGAPARPAGRARAPRRRHRARRLVRRSGVSSARATRSAQKREGGGEQHVAREPVEEDRRSPGRRAARPPVSSPATRAEAPRDGPPADDRAARRARPRTPRCDRPSVEQGAGDDRRHRALA